MAHLHRLICFLFFAFFSAFVAASIPANPSYKIDTTFGSTPAAVCSSFVSGIGFTSPYSATGVAASSSSCSVTILKSGAIYNTLSYQIYLVPPSCPANSAFSGSSCLCNSGYVENAAHTACEVPSVCKAGQKSEYSVQLGWAPLGSSPTTVRPDNLCDNSSVSASNPSAPSCDVSLGGVGVSSPYGPVVNGSQAWVFQATGTTTGKTCSSPPYNPTEAAPPPPPCAGESGMVNGVSVCLAKESDASKSSRAAAAAAAAASAASAAAKAAGASPDAAAAAGKAAGEAASQTTLSGGSSSAAAAAGRSAGTAASSSVTASEAAGIPPATANKTAADAAAAAGAGAAARAAAEAAAAAAGASAAAIAAAGAAASKAASDAAAAASKAGTDARTAADTARAAGDAAAARITAAANDAAAAAAAASKAAGESAAQQAAAAQAAGDAAAASIKAAGDAAAAAVNAAAAAAAAAASKGGFGLPSSKNPITEYCEQNPTSVICKKSFDTEYSASCGSPPQCKGDAIMCATANASFESACTLNPKQNAESDLYDAEKAKTGNRNSEVSDKDQVTISGSNFNSTNLFGSGACIPDRTYTIAGRPVEIPFSKVCDSLLMLGKLLVGISFLLAGRIVVRG